MNDTTSQAPAALADTLVEMGRAAMAFGEIDRLSVCHPDQTTPESDSDHTVMLGWLACSLADACYPDLNVGLVAQFALIHDAPEVYAGDTPTLRITAQGRAAKEAREQAAIARFRSEFADLPWFPRMAAVYDKRHSREARFVWAVDKIVPKVGHLLDGGAGLIRTRHTREELVHAYAEQHAVIGEWTNDLPGLLPLYQALVNRVLNLPALADQRRAG